MIQRQSVRLSNSAKLAIVIAFVVSMKLYSMYISMNESTEKPLVEHLSEEEFLNAEFDPSQLLEQDEYTETEEITDEMREVINKLRDQIKTETKDYKLPSLRSVEELIPEKGGVPMRSVVITSWRSGSTFIGGVLNSHPATYHFSEPLTDYRTVQIRSEPLASSAVKALRNLLTCNYNALGRYLKRSKEYRWLFGHNTRVWAHSKDHMKVFWLPQFLKPVCKLFPFQSMKVVHIRLREVESLLADPKLNVRMAYLIRDPRGILSSRSTLNWCLKSDDCSSPVRVCADIVDDYSAAHRFSQLYPDRFTIVRYEDMSLRPKEKIPDLFKFFGLQYHSDVERFVEDHTTKMEKNRYSTYRNSSEAALSWRSKLNYEKTKELQKTCRVAILAWGYLLALNSSHQQTFNPLVEPFSLT